MPVKSETPYGFPLTRERQRGYLLSASLRNPLALTTNTVTRKGAVVPAKAGTHARSIEGGGPYGFPRAR